MCFPQPNLAPSRRELVIGALALLALPLPLTAGATAAPDVVKHVQSVMLGFDLGDVVARAAEMAGLPRRYITRWREAVGDRFAGLGLRAVDVLDDDPAFSEVIRGVVHEAFDSLGVKLRLRRLIKRLDGRPSAIEPLIDRLVGELLGLDVAALRAHRAGLDRDGLLIVYGGALTLMDLGATLVSHLMTLFLEAVHGRRATVVYSQQPKAELLRSLLDPAVRVVAFVGHGEWSTFSTNGPGGPPGEVWSRLVRKLQSDLRPTVSSLAGGRLTEVLPATRGELDEHSLAALLDGWYTSPRARADAAKDLVVRYTCGSSRYAARAYLVWELLPDELRERSHRGRWGRSISAESPDDLEWEDDMGRFLAEHDVSVLAGPALGTSLVRDPENTRGYSGLSWLDDFIETPIPEFLPDPPFARRPDAKK